MVILYTSAGCVSCRKAKQWFKQNDVEFLEKNIFRVLLDKKEISYLISRCENGADDIISRRSKIIRESKIDINSFSFSELVIFIQRNPSILRRPIIINVANLMIGYDDEEIDAFKPRKEFMDQCSLDCPNYPMCGHTRLA